MTIDSQGHEWSEEALFSKAQLYAEQMERHTSEDWQFGLWSALLLEFLGRASLAHISPALLAGSQNWRNLAHALGRKTIGKPFQPSSISARDVFERLHAIDPSFSREMQTFCSQHTGRRNSELHSGILAFEVLGTSEWLATFYWTCKAMLETMGKDLASLVHDSQAAEEMITSLEDASAKEVNEAIRAHKMVWEGKSDSERQLAVDRARVSAQRHLGHRVDCPACGSPALVKGTPSGPVLTETSDDEVVERQSHLPASFECKSCDLKIAGYSKLSLCSLGDSFTKTTAWSPAEYHGLHTADELEDARGEIYEYEPDFND